MRIYLIGFMGSGKSSIGSELAHKLEHIFIDLDDVIEKTSGRKIGDIFKIDGENGFREIEHECLKKTFLNDTIVVATGGGTPCYNNNMELINRHGISIYIKLNQGILASRLFSDKGTRPLIKNYTNIKELQKFIEDSLEKREKFYLQSKLIIEGKNISAKKIIEMLAGHTVY
ncbi:MAG: shikimate kinase [Bacteroidales bacterium]